MLDRKSELVLFQQWNIMDCDISQFIETEGLSFYFSFLSFFFLAVDVLIEGRYFLYPNYSL